jgi:hypothetical protein
MTEQHEQKAIDPDVLETDADALRPQSMLETLSRLHGGRLLDTLQVELSRVVAEVVNNASGKGGKLVLELVVEKPNAKLNLKGREIILEASVKVKMPDDPPDAAVFYYDDRGGLHNQDPYQARLRFR